MSDTPTVQEKPANNPQVEESASTENVNEESTTYGQILKSSAIIGASSVINLLITMIRTKLMALLLGPSGIGLMSMYTAIADLAQSIGGMGISSSGVRQIAEAVGSDDESKIARTAYVLRRTVWFLGLLAVVVLFALAAPIADFSFGDSRRASDVGLLGLAVLFGLIASGQGALLQGLRQISSLARMSILGAILGSIIGLSMVYYLREQGLALTVVLISATSLAISWWFRRRIKLPVIKPGKHELALEQLTLLKLGFAFMASGLMMTGAAYVIRMMVTKNLGFAAAGLYQSAWSLGGLYIGIILGAMGTDFYPRLTAVAANNPHCNRLVNEQTHVSVLLAGPGVIGTLALAPLVLTVFYSAQFDGASGVLRWLCLGMAMRVVSWPMGYIIIAKSANNFFIFSEFAWTVVYLASAWWFTGHYGLVGVGIAFFASYAFHVVMNYAIVKKLSDFRMTPINIQTNVLYFSLYVVIFLGYYTLPFIWAIIAGVVAVLLTSIYSVQALLDLVAPERIPQRILRCLKWLRLGFDPASGQTNQKDGLDQSRSGRLSTLRRCIYAYVALLAAIEIVLAEGTVLTILMQLSETAFLQRNL
jgi:enterobacterial common antigen flippase